MFFRYRYYVPFHFSWTVHGDNDDAYLSLSLERMILCTYTALISKRDRHLLSMIPTLYFCFLPKEITTKEYNIYKYRYYIYRVCRGDKPSHCVFMFKHEASATEPNVSIDLGDVKVWRAFVLSVNKRFGKKNTQALYRGSWREHIFFYPCLSTSHSIFSFSFFNHNIISFLL